MDEWLSAQTENSKEEGREGGREGGQEGTYLGKRAETAQFLRQSTRR